MRARRVRIIRWATALAAGLAAAPAWGHDPVPTAPTIVTPPPSPAPLAPPRLPAPPRGGPIRRAFQHAGFTLHDKLIGYPEQFNEPPLGAALYGTLGAMKAKADVHDFVLYQSDFVPGSIGLSPAGSERINRMATRLPNWVGPITVEWTPDRPGLAESRKAAIVALLQGAGLPVVPERVLVGPSPYPGQLGADAANNYDNLIFRDSRAARNFSVSPTTTATFGGGVR
jgi:hypothetical protein